MEKQAAQIYTVCECIDQCFAFVLWCNDFAPYLDEEDMLSGLDRGAAVVSVASRLQSCLALRKLDDFLAAAKGKDDLVAATLGIDPKSVLADGGERLLTNDERATISKQVAHLTDRLTLDDYTEFDLDGLLTRSIPVFSRLSATLRKADTSGEATHWLDKTDALIKRENDELAARPEEKAQSVQPQ